MSNLFSFQEALVLPSISCAKRCEHLETVVRNAKVAMEGGSDPAEDARIKACACYRLSRVGHPNADLIRTFVVMEGKGVVLRIRIGPPNVALSNVVRDQFNTRGLTCVSNKARVVEAHRLNEEVNSFYQRQGFSELEYK